MMLLRAFAWARVPDSNRLRCSSAPEAASTPEESYDTASLFRGRKFRLRADCCKTSALSARGARRDRHRYLRLGLRIVHERCVPPSAAGWQFPRSEGKTPPPALPPSPAVPPFFSLPPRAAEFPLPAL